MSKLQEAAGTGGESCLEQQSHTTASRAAQVSPLVSIVVPVYNVRAYLKRCLDSLLKQSLKEIEIILVDDGSTDGSGALCDELAQADRRIRVIHQQNGGLSAARNRGVLEARAPYVGFVDSDDWVEEQMYERLYQLIQDHQADISICGVRDCYVNREEIPPQIPDRCMNPQEVLEDISLNTTLMVGIPPRLYPRWLFDEVSSPLGKMHEDAFIVVDIFSRMNKIAVTSEPLYVYYHQGASITSAAYGQASLDNIEAWEKVSRQVKSLYPHNSALQEACAFRLYWAHFAALDDMVCADPAKVLTSDKKRVIGFLKANRARILSHPAVSKSRKLALRALSLSEACYKLLVVLNQRRQHLH